MPKSWTLQEMQEIYDTYPELQLVEIEPEKKEELDFATLNEKCDLILEKIKQKKSKTLNNKG